MLLLYSSIHLRVKQLSEHQPSYAKYSCVPVSPSDWTPALDNVRLDDVTFVILTITADGSI